MRSCPYASYCLEHGDLGLAAKVRQSAERESDERPGLAKEARVTLETRQIVEILTAYASAVGIGTLQVQQQEGLGRVLWRSCSVSNRQCTWKVLQQGLRIVLEVKVTSTVANVLCCIHLLSCQSTPGYVLQHCNIFILQVFTDQAVEPVK